MHIVIDRTRLVFNAVIPLAYKILSVVFKAALFVNHPDTYQYVLPSETHTASHLPQLRLLTEFATVIPLAYEILSVVAT